MFKQISVPTKQKSLKNKMHVSLFLLKHGHFGNTKYPILLQYTLSPRSMKAIDVIETASLSWEWSAQYQSWPSSDVVSTGFVRKSR
jgi:hypothetical protein